MKISEDNSSSRTIHMSKGDEFENVLVLLESQKDLRFITSPQLSKEEHRVLYVAVSRSRDGLYLNVPELDASFESELSTYFDIHRLVDAGNS